MIVYGKCECFVIHMLYVCVLCTSYDNSQCRFLHYVQFVNAGRGFKGRPYGRGILQSRCHDCFVVSYECILMFTPTDTVVFIYL